jgi:glutamyl/glutaminyl-tRNA synthetase
LSWSPGDNREVIDIHEAIKLFEIKDVNKTAAAFDLKKLDWMNNQYLKNTAPETLLVQLTPLLQERNFIPQNNFDSNYLVSLVKLFRERLDRVNDFLEKADFFFQTEIQIDPAAEKKFLSRDFSREFTLFLERLEALENFDVVSIERAFRDLVKELNMETKDLIHPVRVAITGKTTGPGLFDVIYYLGLARIKKRLGRFIRARSEDRSL